MRRGGGWRSYRDDDGNTTQDFHPERQPPALNISKNAFFLMGTLKRFPLISLLAPSTFRATRLGTTHRHSTAI
jgi:hypothetical protein